MNESRRPLTVAALAVRTAQEAESGALALSDLEDRIIAVEEVLAARWPRSRLLRRRLARSLRATDAAYRDAAGSFAGRRVQAAGDELIAAAARHHEARG
jgi:hypothetical protein